MPQPDGGRDQLEQPDGQDDAKLFDSVEVTKPGEALSIEQRRTDDRLQQVIGQGHSPHSGQAVTETGPGPPVVQPDHESEVAQCQEEAAPVVVLEMAKGGVWKRPPGGEVLGHPPNNQRESTQEAAPPEAQVECR